MTDKEIFEKYCEYNNKKYKEWECFMLYMEDSLSYKLFELKIATDELKQAIKDTLFFWRKK